MSTGSIDTITSILEQPESMTPEQEQQIIGIFGVLSPEERAEIILDLDVATMTLFCELINKTFINECVPLWRNKYQQLYGKQAPMLDPDWGPTRPNTSHRLPHPLVGSTWKWNLLNMGVYGFGSNFTGELGLGPDSEQKVSAPRRIREKWSPMKIIQVSAGGEHTVCLDENGNVWTFGRNNVGRLGLGPDFADFKEVNIPQQIPGLPRITHVSAGGDHTVCLDGNGNVWTFGSNGSGQLGLGPDSEEDVNTPQKIPKELLPLRITRISAGFRHTVCLDENGDVWGFGDNFDSQLGLGVTSKEPTPKIIPGLPRITQVSAGGHHTVCLGDNGNVWGVGNNISGQLGLGPDSERTVTTPQQIPVERLPIKITQISAGKHHTVLLDGKGNVWTFGWNIASQLGLGPNFEDVNTPQQILDLSRIIQVSAGRVHTMCLDENGHIWGFGSNRDGQLGLGYIPKILSPQTRKPIPQKIEDIKAVQVSAGNIHTIIIGL